MESTSILHRTAESERGLMVGCIYNYLTIKNKHMNLSFLVKVLVQKFVLGNCLWQNHNTNFGRQISHIFCSRKPVSHEFLLFYTQYLPGMFTLSSYMYLSSNLHPETTHKSNWQHQNTVRQIQNSDLGKCQIATHCAVWPGWEWHL